MATTTKKKPASRVKTGKAAKKSNQPATRPIQRDRMARPESERNQPNPGEEHLNPPAGIPFPNPSTPQRNPEMQRDPQDRANHEQWEEEKPVPGGMHYAGDEEDVIDSRD